VNASSTPRSGAALDLDAVLRVLSSPTRRAILARLANESHYPLQLSRELGVSQQAIMKHMRVLEEVGVVRGVEEPSDQGGPPRTAFELTASLSLSIDVGPSLFSTRLEVQEAPGRSRRPQAEGAEGTPREALAMRLSEVSKEVSEIDREIHRLEGRRLELVARKNRVLDEAHALIGEMSDKYLSRRILYWITETDEFSVPQLAEAFNLRERVAQEAYRELLRAHLVPEYKIRRLR
jgi:predicted transcriptional regulator